RDQQAARTEQAPSRAVERAVATYAHHPRAHGRTGGVAQRKDLVGQYVVMEPNRIGEAVNMKIVRGNVERRSDDVGREIGRWNRQGLGGDARDGVDNSSLPVCRVK